MPDKTDKVVHPTNPTHADEWAKLSDSKDFYVIQHASVGHAQTTRIYEVTDQHGPAVVPRKTDIGDPLTEGAIVSAKSFGPGADLQRLVDLGAIRPATQWEAETVAGELSGEAAKAREEKAKKDKAVEPAKTVEPAKKDVAPVVESPKVEPAKVEIKAEPKVEPEKK